MNDVEAEDNSDGRYFLNIFSVHEDATEKDIREFYRQVNLVKVHPAMPGAFDLEFHSKEELIRAIDIPETVLLKHPFYIRSSYFKIREGRGRDAPRGSRFRGDRDRDRGRPDRRDRYARLTRFEGDRPPAGDLDDREKYSGFRDRPRGDGYRDKEAPPPRRWEDREPQGAREEPRPRAGAEESGTSKAVGSGVQGPDRSGVVKSRGALA